MAQELELSEYANVNELKGFDRTEKNPSRNTDQSGRRLLRIGVLTLGVLCIIQAALNISLRLAFYSKEDIDQFPFNSPLIADFCQIDQSQQNSNQLCSCCNNLLRKLLKEYQNLKTERDLLLDMVSQLTKAGTINIDDFQDSGSGAGSDFDINEY